MKKEISDDDSGERKKDHLNITDDAEFPSMTVYINEKKYLYDIQKCRAEHPRTFESGTEISGERRFFYHSIGHADDKAGEHNGEELEKVLHIELL